MHAATVSARIKRPEGIRRLGQALWMMVGERVDSAAELLWARALLGAAGEEALWGDLVKQGCFGPDKVLLARPLAEFLCSLWEVPGRTEASLLWTLPSGLSVSGVDECGYVAGVLKLIRSARTRLLFLAPYIEAKGIGRLQEALLAALARKVSVVLVTQDAGTLGSWASESLESLRREARALPGGLQVYTAPPTAEVFLHSKLVVSDGVAASVGSANLTGSALAKNLETGVLVGASLAAEVERVVKRAIDLRQVTLAFQVGTPPD